MSDDNDLEEAKRSEILAMEGRLESANHYELLGISPRATADTHEWQSSCARRRS